jgi:aminobenzoyl-glutamate utilization protein A
VPTLKELRGIHAREDAHLIGRVQKQGGTATYMGVGAANVAPHHTARFDIDEAALEVGVDVVVETARSLGA